MTWRDDPRRACRGVNPNVFFPEARGIHTARDEEKAKAICARCPVRQPCLDWAAENLTHGVAGGKTARERSRWAQRRRRAVIDIDQYLGRTAQ